MAQIDHFPPFLVIFSCVDQYKLTKSTPSSLQYLNSYQNLQSQERLKMGKNDKKQLFLPILTILYLKLVWRSWYMLIIVTYSTHSRFGLTCWLKIKFTEPKMTRFLFCPYVWHSYTPQAWPVQLILANHKEAIASINREVLWWRMVENGFSAIQICFQKCMVRYLLGQRSLLA